MKTITEKEIDKVNNLLHDEIVQSVKDNDTTVLFEIIERMNNTDKFYSLSDKGQSQIKFI